MGGEFKNLKSLVVIVMLIGSANSQVDPLTDDPCADQHPPSGGRRFSDNLSCPRIDGVLQCYQRSQLCDNVQLCTGGSDEGINIVSLDCGGVLSGTGVDTFVCTPGENIDISRLCDGNDDCTNGDDETTTLCENKCLEPYGGGCVDLNRVCISSEFDVNCGLCLEGFEVDPTSTTTPSACRRIPIVIGFQFTLYQPSEGNSQQVCLVINAQPAMDISVQVSSTDRGSGPNDATVALDYVQFGPQTVMFPSGSQAPQCINVQTNEDLIAELEECFLLNAILATVPGPDQTITINPPQATVCIQDDDLIEFRLETPTVVTEGTDLSAAVCARLITGQLSQPATISFDIGLQPGSALNPEDFLTNIATSVVFPSGTAPNGANALMCINVPIVNDARVELTESFSVSASSTIGTFPGGSFATITILDDDVAIFQFTQPTYQDTEGNNLDAAIQLVNGELTFPINVQVLTADFTGQPNAATANVDYIPLTLNAPNQVILTFPSGSSPGSATSQQTLQVSLIEDDLAENTESFELSAFTTISQADFTQDRDVAVGLILNDDVCQIGFEQTSYTTLEGNLQEVCLIKLNNVILGGPTTVNVQTIGGGTKTANLDYVPFNGQVTFQPGSTRECVFIQTLDDQVDEDEECVPISASAQNNPSIQIVQSLTEVCCTDDDLNTFQFVEILIDVPENGPQAQCCIQLVDGTLGRLTTITVDVVAIPGSAQIGADVAANRATLQYPANTIPGSAQATQCFPTTVLPDNQVEDTESYQLSASSTDQSVEFTPGRQIKTVNIIEDPNDVVDICLQLPTGDTVLENAGPHQECVEITGLPDRLEKSVSLMLSTSNGPNVETDAQAPVDYTGLINQVITFTPMNQNDPMCVPIQINNDLICENDETFSVNLMSNDPCVTINAAICTGTVTIQDDDVATVRSTQPTYSVNEGETLEIDIQLFGQKGPGRECVVSVSTMDGTALSTVMWRDYFALPPTMLTFDSSNTVESIFINVCDDSKCEGDEEFEVILSTSSDGCTVDNTPIPVTIIDDEVDTHGLGDDPHFSIALPSGELLCYTVQGEHGFSFNLISNHKMAMNAKFVPDARRPEVTWLGSIGIIVQNTNYKGSNETKLRFDVDTKSIYIGDKVELEARNIEKLTFTNGKLTISEAPPKEGFHYPSVYVDLEDVQLQFTVKYTNQHLDIYWHSTGGRLSDSHGLIGQFFRKGVEIDEVRKILIMPNKEPIPVMRRPVWSFMEREMSDEQLCWTAMNPGYQGEGLIDGTYFDYLVDDVLSTDFKFEKQH